MSYPETKLVAWMEARLAKRRANKGPPPACVKDFCDTLDGKPDENADAGPPVIDWVHRSIEDPNWPTSIE